MANYSVPAGHVGVHEKQLAVSTVDTVTFTGVSRLAVEVLSDGSSDIYVTFGAGNTPTVAGTQCYRVPAGSVSAVFTPESSGDVVVNLISAGTPVYSVSKS